MKWQEFSDSSEATIQKDPTMFPVNKLNYLRQQSTQSDRGTSVNKEAAITFLQGLNGKKQMVPEAHFTYLMDLSQESNNTIPLRVNYERQENIRDIYNH